jgi:ribonuclease R
VHIAGRLTLREDRTPLDLEAAERGNSSYFPGHVVPMLPEILSNGVCSLQEAVPRLCKSVFITYDDDAKPVRAERSPTRSSRAVNVCDTPSAGPDRRQGADPHPDGPST